MSFFESFEEFTLRTDRAKCTCSKKQWSWDHFASCAVGAAYSEWVAANAVLWDKLRLSSSYDPTKIEKVAARFR